MELHNAFSWLGQRHATTCAEPSSQRVSPRLATQYPLLLVVAEYTKGEVRARHKAQPRNSGYAPSGGRARRRGKASASGIPWPGEFQRFYVQSPDVGRLLGGQGGLRPSCRRRHSLSGEH
jgi:hypothetical protein